MVYVSAAMLLLFSAQAPTDVGSGPEPAATQVSWELEFKFLDPQRIEVQLPDSDTPTVYWYMVYTVTNPDRRSRRFHPTFQLVTDDLQVIDTDMGISKLVFDQIKERHRKTHKYLVHPTKALGALLTGDDNARESVAIWRQVDLSINNFKIYVAGLSGETRFMPNPAYDSTKPEEVVDPQTGVKRRVNPKHFALRKTLEIRYNLPGSPSARPLAEPERCQTRWVMR